MIFKKRAKVNSIALTDIQYAAIRRAQIEVRMEHGVHLPEWSFDSEKWFTRIDRSIHRVESVYVSSSDKIVTFSYDKFGNGGYTFGNVTWNSTESEF